MPELPEIETLAVQLQKKMSGRVLSHILIRNGSVLETPRAVFKKKLPGRKILGLSRRGKFLRLRFDQDISLWFHLGMTGQLLWRQESFAQDPHVHVVISFEQTAETLVFRDIRRFGSISLSNGRPDSLPPRVRRLGPEPLEMKEADFVRLFNQRKGRIKSLLMNQHLLAGLGNIYADESLHRAGIDPRRRPHRLKGSALARLHEAVCETLREAIRSGGSSIDDFLHADGGQGKFQNFHRVYGRAGEKCFVCGSFIRRIVLAGRSASFCPSCQK